MINALYKFHKNMSSGLVFSEVKNWNMKRQYERLQSQTATIPTSFARISLKLQEKLTFCHGEHILTV